MNMDGAADGAGHNMLCPYPDARLPSPPLTPAAPRATLGP